VGILQNYCRGGNKNIALIASKGMFIGLMLGLLAFLPVNATAEEDLSTNYIQQAKALKLAQQPAWLNLLHYKSNAWGSLISQADDAKFFMAETGAEDAQAELEADLRGFFSVVDSEDNIAQVKNHPQCRFPARLHWLNQQLNFAGLLPKVECANFNEWKRQWNATQITLLFPSMYLGNPASMFGHTFIRFDTEGKSQLLSPTLSYAAASDKTDSLIVFSWKGIFGGYVGRFSMQPYYETLGEYSDIEQRDIWEYKLNLSQAETEQLVRHLLEVSGVHFDYFFLRENCAFRLLALLDVAREGIDMSLTTHPIYAIPVDTVRDIQQAGLIADTKYRPATHNKIKYMVAQMNVPSRAAAFSIVDHSLSIKDLSINLNTKQQARALELANEILGQERTVNQALQMQVLSARSQLQVDASPVKFTATSPETSHASARWNIGLGENNNQRFYEIGLRLNFHDALDPLQGFPEGVSINILDTQFRWYEDVEQLKLENINVFSMQSISAVEKWTVPVSKKLSFQLNKRNFSSGDRHHVLETQVAAGYAKNIKDVLFYALVNGRLDYASTLKKNHASYVGGDVGFIWGFKVFGIKGQSQFVAQNFQRLSGEQGDVQSIQLGMQFDITKNSGVRVEYKKDDYSALEIEEAKLSYLSYF
jgi:Domain of unknown function (DUF4105)